MDEETRPERPKFLRALSGEAVWPPPLWLMRQAGRYLPEYRAIRMQAPSFLDFCYNPKATVEATLQPIRRFGFDAAILFSDILVVPDALGQPVSFESGEGPRLAPIIDEVGLARLRETIDLDRLAPVFETVARLKQDLPPGRAAHRLLRRAVDGGKLHDRRPRHAGSSAGPTVRLPPSAALRSHHRPADQRFHHLSLPADRSRRRRHSDLRHLGRGSADGRVRPLVRVAHRRIVAASRRSTRRCRSSSSRAAQVRAWCELKRRRRTPTRSGSTPQSIRTGPRPCRNPPVLQGNLDPLALIAGGAALEEAVTRILAAFRHRPHIFNLGHGILPETPIAHVERLVELVRRDQP